jgi:Fe-S-cluster-containing dehydrogenase component
MARCGMVIDITKCNGCYNCFLACKDEHCGNDYPPYALSQPMIGQFWIRLIEKERGKYPKVKVAYTPIPCMHCEEPRCLKASTGGAVYKRADGIMLIDPEKSRGQKGIVSACPYGAIFWNEEKQVPQKCTFCAHLLDKGWKEPRCVEVCPTGALAFGDLDDPRSEVSRLATSGHAVVLNSEYNMREKVTYIGLPRRFIAGAVVFGDTGECAEGVKITLYGENDTRTTGSNNYGDFEFEDLPEDSDFKIDVKFSGYKTRSFKVKTTEDVYLGDITLEKASSKRTNK